MYVHDAINDYVTCGDTVIVAHELGQKLTELSRMNQRTRKSGFGEQFKVSGNTIPNITLPRLQDVFNCPTDAGRLVSGDL